MKLGVFGLNSKATSGPAATTRLAKRCEELGYDSWWVGEQAAQSVEALRVARGQFTRPAELGELEISVTPRGPVTADSLHAYADAGVDRLIVYPLPVDDEAEVDHFVAQQAELVLG